MKRLIDEQGEAAKWLAAAAEVPAFDQASRLRVRRALVAPSSPSQGLRLALAFAASVVLGVGGTWLIIRPGTARENTAPQVVASPGAVLRPLANGVELRDGRITVSTMTPLMVLTPQLEVQVQRGRAAVEVAWGASTVQWLEGVTVVKRQGREVTLAPGERLHSDDARLAVLRELVPEAPPETTTCDGGDVEACLTRVSAGGDVSAQAALLRLALGAVVRGDWHNADAVARQSLGRFPEGVLVPELHLVRFEALRQLKQGGAARAEASWYLTNQTTAPSAPLVALLLGELELREGALAAARVAFAKTLELNPSAEVRHEALFGLGVVDLREGLPARAHFAAALEAAPKGPRAAELERLLRE
jgi:hypothetical protein